MTGGRLAYLNLELGSQRGRVGPTTRSPAGAIVRLTSTYTTRPPRAGAADGYAVFALDD
jgi:hypothetical protein